jgi:hypothetical protein
VFCGRQSDEDLSERLHHLLQQVEPSCCAECCQHRQRWQTLADMASSKMWPAQVCVALQAWLGGIFLQAVCCLLSMHV